MIGLYPRNVASDVRKAFEAYFLGTDENGEQITTSDNLGKVLKNADEMGAGVQNDILKIGYMTLGTISNYDVHILSIDGVVPSAETAASGEYPYTIDLYLVTNGDVSDKAAAFIDYIHSDEAMDYMQQNNYVIP